MGAEVLPAPLWSQLGTLISERIGLNFPPERHGDLVRALESAAGDFGHADAIDCARWLVRAELSGEDLRKLAAHVTIGETYFFRERPSFNAMATEVLPPLIHRRRETSKRLRLWSAACSTGEEAYSLAILLQQLIPDWRDWKISILATDINPKALHRAESGVYSDWSFRESAPDFRARWFEPVGAKQYRVRRELRELVTFAELNLAGADFPSLATDTNAIDLILCRNLLMYFTPAHARALIARLHRCLADEGWLIVSPSECSQALFTGFAPVNFPGTILYRKRGAGDAAPVPPRPATPIEPAVALALPDPPEPLPAADVARILTESVTPTIARHDAVAAALADAEASHQRGDYGDAIDRLQAALAESSDGDPRLLAALAHALANQGRLAEALAAGELWCATDKLDAAAHHLVAMVLQELGHRTEARAALQRALYLQPDLAIAHFSMGNLARAEARPDEARRHFSNAARLLRGHDAAEIVPASEGMNVGRLREITEALLRGADT
ncbi:MAG TPA: CheR family methyltransferase [Steroidobacteraceae bacterium]|nr:CheR family methyltransferase [Steroidobacteraceae bacterium]